MVTDYCTRKAGAKEALILKKSNLEYVLRQIVWFNPSSSGGKQVWITQADNSKIDAKTLGYILVPVIPAMLRALKIAADAAHEEGIGIGVCSYSEFSLIAGLKDYQGEFDLIIRFFQFIMGVSADISGH